MDRKGPLYISGDMPAEKALLLQNKLTELVMKKVCTIVVDDLWLWIRYRESGWGLGNGKGGTKAGFARDLDRTQAGGDLGKIDLGERRFKCSWEKS